MSRKDDLMSKIREGERKLEEHRRETDWWVKELGNLNRDLTDEIRREQDEARNSSGHRY